MNASQKLKHMILLRALDFRMPEPSMPITAENIDTLYQVAEENDGGWLQDARNEIRSTGEKTGLTAPWSRHYESDAVAAKAPDGTWVGWTYWYGGGKFGQPETIDWIEDAYDVDVTEEEKTVVVRNFTVPA